MRRFVTSWLVLLAVLATTGCGDGDDDRTRPSPAPTPLAQCSPLPAELDRCTRHDECGPGGECVPFDVPEGACKCAFGGPCVFREIIQDCAGSCDDDGFPPCVSGYDLDPEHGDPHECLCAVPEPHCDRDAGGCATNADCREPDGVCVPFFVDDPFFCTCRFTDECRFRPEQGFCAGSCGSFSNCISAADMFPSGDPEACFCEPPTPVPSVATPQAMSTP